jgi:futalosine hydrolase
MPRPLIVVATEAEVPQGDFDALVCGVGKTGAAASTLAELSGRAARGGLPSAVVSFGVAGAYPAAGLDVGDVVVASEVAVVDEGLETGDRFVPFERAGMTVPAAAWTPCDAALVGRLVSGPRPGFRVVTGRVATVSVCAGTARLADERARGGVLAEGMEGAAVAFACAHHGLPFVEVRGVSNLCGPREGGRFDLAVAVRHAAAVLAALGGRA